MVIFKLCVNSFMWLCVSHFCDRYNINTMYAMAASIPKYENQLSYDLTKAMLNLQPNWNDGILRTPRLVVATKKDVTTNLNEYTEHAEWRVLQNLNLEGQDGDLLVFFSYASPCNEKCANPKGNFRITDGLKTLFKKNVWGGKAFVFEVIFKPSGKDIDFVEIKRSTTEALKNIEKVIGSENIFRCYRPDNRYYTCIRCFSGGKIVENCIS